MAAIEDQADVIDEIKENVFRKRRDNNRNESFYEHWQKVPRKSEKNRQEFLKESHKKGGEQ